ncbi:hypothetical protein [Sphingobacterium gobiense]|uniref:Transposase n=1 Tax=Sphingobacterium gobiense TaxID=1382456 RepID=A0A2S9JTC3_9SPHI|nr:hypothetical protein [Sphingobacterium gobiense]PRD56500.1 hypothetical protein C5749_04455 [Sphingobacterium gobiense]
MKPSVIRYQKEIKEGVVQAIIKGDLLLEEAMEKYGIMTKKTIVRWLKRQQYEILKGGQQTSKT